MIWKKKKKMKLITTWQLFCPNCKTSTSEREIEFGQTASFEEKVDEVSKNSFSSLIENNASIVKL